MTLNGNSDCRLAEVQIDAAIVRGLSDMGRQDMEQAITDLMEDYNSGVQDRRDRRCRFLLTSDAQEPVTNISLCRQEKLLQFSCTTLSRQMAKLELYTKQLATCLFKHSLAIYAHGEAYLKTDMEALPRLERSRKLAHDRSATGLQELFAPVLDLDHQTGRRFVDVLTPIVLPYQRGPFLASYQSAFNARTLDH